MISAFSCILARSSYAPPLCLVHLLVACVNHTVDLEALLPQFLLKSRIPLAEGNLIATRTAYRPPRRRHTAGKEKDRRQLQGLKRGCLMYTPLHTYNAMLRAVEKRAFGVDTFRSPLIGGAVHTKLGFWRRKLRASEPNQPRQYPFTNQTKPAPVGGGPLQ